MSNFTVDPVFIVSAPCAGVSALHTGLSRATNARQLSPTGRAKMRTLMGALDATSDRRTADAARPTVVRAVRDVLNQELHASERWLSGAITNALSIPFLNAAFPKAHYVYLYRDPRAQLERMIAAWCSGLFVTHSHLNGWAGLPWSLPLIPEWRLLRDKSLSEIVGAQWAASTAHLLNDLTHLPEERWCAVRLDDLVKDPRQELEAIAHFVGLTLPPARDPLVTQDWQQWGVGSAAVAEAARLVMPTIADLVRQALDICGAHHPSLMQLAHVLESTPTRSPRARSRGRSMLAAGLLAGSVALPLALPKAALAATFTVTNTNDWGAGSLRQAMWDASNTSGADVVSFAPGVTGTIELTDGSLSCWGGRIDIQGPGADALTILGDNASRVFYLYCGSANLSGLTITGGSSQNSGGGGGIYSFGALTLDDVKITENSSAYDGGGVRSNGSLTVRNSEISNNTAADDGGGLRVERNLVIQNSKISGNTAGDEGGGISDNGQSFTIEDTTIANNSARVGGGLSQNSFYFYSGSVVRSTVSGNTAAQSGGGLAFTAYGYGVLLENVTIADNSADVGGGVLVQGVSDVAVRFATIVDNTATTQGGGVFALYSSLGFSHSIITGNNANGVASNIDGGPFFVGIANSLLSTALPTGTTDSGGNIFNADAQLGPLQDNGGLTFTRLPASTSPAINAGDPAFVVPATDQRGMPRVDFYFPDLGAVETTTPKLANGEPLPLAVVCSAPVAEAICQSQVCDTDDLCGLPVDDPCTPNIGKDPCRGGHCGGVTQVCFAGTGCEVDGDCRDRESAYCDSTNHCVSKLADGVSVPTDAEHNNGVCTPAVAAAVCQSGVCRDSQNVCGCADDSDCETASFCNTDSHACTPDLAAGANCDRPAQCVSNGCGVASHVCLTTVEGCNTDSDCNIFEFCDSAELICTHKLAANEACSGNEQCTAAVCGGDGRCGLPNGTACTASKDCRSGTCADEVCVTPSRKSYISTRDDGAGCTCHATTNSPSARTLGLGGLLALLAGLIRRVRLRNSRVK